MVSNDEFTDFWNKMQNRLSGKEINVTMENDIDNSGFLKPNFDDKHSCGAAINSLSIDSDGSIYPCQAAHLPEFKAGNLRDNSIKEIWKNSEGFRSWLDFTVDTIEECNGCIWQNYCGGGCRMQAYTAHEKMNSAFHFCEFTKDYMEMCIEKYLEWLWNKNNKTE